MGEEKRLRELELLCMVSKHYLLDLMIERVYQNHSSHLDIMIFTSICWSSSEIFEEKYACLPDLATQQTFNKLSIII